jgi:hypothetical protein
MLYNPASDKADRFQVIAQGLRETTAKSVAVRHGRRIGSCEIAGLGEAATTVDSIGACVPSCGNFDPRQPLTIEEILRFNTTDDSGNPIECSLRFVFNAETGEVIEEPLYPGGPFTDLTPDSITAGCDFEKYDVSQIELVLTDGSGTTIGGGAATFGDGILSTGSDSCTTRVIGGRVYTWGRPCP